MAKKYYRWKDENCNGVNPEWIEITGQEFYDYVDSSEIGGKYFIKEYFYPDNKELGFYAYETTKRQYNEWHKLYMQKLRYENNQKEIGYKMVSLDEEFDESEEMTLHEAVSDESVDVEESAILAYRINKIYEALEQLSEDEADLIYALYLNKPIMTERSYAKQKGISGVAIHKKKIIVLEKMRKILKNF